MIGYDVTYQIHNHGLSNLFKGLTIFNLFVGLVGITLHLIDMAYLYSFI